MNITKVEIRVTFGDGRTVDLVPDSEQLVHAEFSVAVPPVVTGTVDGEHNGQPVQILSKKAGPLTFVNVAAVTRQKGDGG